MKSFEEALQDELESAVRNNHQDNWDDRRFPQRPSFSLMAELNFQLSGWLPGKNALSSRNISKGLTAVSSQVPYFAFLYDLLADDASKCLLIKLLAFRALGHRRVKLPLNTPQYWNTLDELERLANPGDSIKSGFEDFVLYHYNLANFGYPLSLYFTPSGVLTEFIVKQYEYRNGDFRIFPKPGDYVVDGGGCWGDTALLFADAVGKDGRVFVFEFIPFNLSLLRKNVSLNPSLEKSVTVMSHPLWDSSDQQIFFKDNGPASVVELQPFEGQTGTASTLSIDDLVKRESLPRLDFIKLDIEGVEMEALKGAISSIRRFKPKLAVAVYHRPSDFRTLAEFIHGLGLGYRFYLAHCTIHYGETILFAVAD